MPADEELTVATERSIANGLRATLQQTSLRQYQLDQVRRVAMPLCADGLSVPCRDSPSFLARQKA
jgi:hypothetical protein